jgi:NAD(P)-dependent dehydrogenase (short-subunit alcohol dehydrogenase family)
MVRKLDGKVALVTGGAQGIGAASAVRLAAEGAAVIVADLFEEGAHAVVAKIVETGGTASYMQLDVTQESAWKQVIAQIKAEYGGLHVLLNNAGIGRPSPIVDFDYETFRQVFSVNLDGMFLGMKHAIPLIEASGGGSIINLSSAASMKPYATMSAYCGSKAGVAHMSKVAALECAQGKKNIRVNSIHPGMVKTPAWDHLGGLEGRDSATPIDLDEMAAQTVPLGFLAVPEDIANAVAFLATDDSRYVTGAELLIDGGAVLL